MVGILLLRGVTSFCESHHIDVPGMNDRHMKSMMRYCQQKDYVIVEHYYQIDLFNTVDFQLMELHNRFTDQTMELLILSSALNLVDSFKSFDIDTICNLAERFYPRDFTKFEILAFRRQLECFQIDVLHLVEFQCISSLSELYRKLIETRKSQIYFLMNILIHLVLTLLISTTTTERTFSAMKLIKTPLRNKMEFLLDYMVIYTKREFVDTIDSDSIID